VARDRGSAMARKADSVLCYSVYSVIREGCILLPPSPAPRTQDTVRPNLSGLNLGSKIGLMLASASENALFYASGAVK
jgi:hypothetical protein